MIEDVPAAPVAAAVALSVVIIAFAACSHDSPVAPAQAATQAAACSYVVSAQALDFSGVYPTGIQVSPAGGRFQVYVNTATGCQWTTFTSDAWIRPAGSTNGDGTGVVVMNVDSLPSTTGRHGAVTVSWSSGSVSIAVDQFGCDVTQSVNLSPE